MAWRGQAAAVDGWQYGGWRQYSAGGETRRENEEASGAKYEAYQWPSMLA